MANLVIIGSQWGDEGKGKIVDIIYNDHPEWLNTKINSFREKAI